MHDHVIMHVHIVHFAHKPYSLFYYSKHVKYVILLHTDLNKHRLTHLISNETWNSFFFIFFL